MREEQHPEHFLAINDEVITYHETATEAVIACGLPRWNCMFQARAAHALKPGDELSLTDHASIIRLTGKDVDYHG